MYNYSVIIPHKNTPDLLLRCLKSIPKKDDIQIIVIDDNSSKDYVDFNNFPGLNNYNVEVYLTKQSRGAGFARNFGLSKAKGNWIIFADADDYFTPSFYSNISEYSNSIYDIVFFNIQCDSTKNVQGFNYQYYIENYNSKVLSSLTDVKYRTWSPWGKLYNRNFIKESEIQFEERIVGNDCFFVLNLNCKSKNVKIDKSKMYVHTFNPSGISHGNNRKFKYDLEIMKLVIWRYNFYNSQNLDEFINGGGIYSKLRSIYMKYGLYKTFQAFIIANNCGANFIKPILNKIK